jgi:hypothetical protein
MAIVTSVATTATAANASQLHCFFFQLISAN